VYYIYGWAEVGEYYIDGWADVGCITYTGGPTWNVLHIRVGRRKGYQIDRWAEGAIKYLLHRQVGRGGV
jgi:hypothetical protein